MFLRVVRCPPLEGSQSASQSVNVGVVIQLKARSGELDVPMYHAVAFSSGMYIGTGDSSCMSSPIWSGLW